MSMSANTVETRQYRKASKALLVLIPLLGLTYLVVMAGPNEGVGSHIFVIARAFLLSTQVSLGHTFIQFDGKPCYLSTSGTFQVGRLTSMRYAPIFLGESQTISLADDPF